MRALLFFLFCLPCFAFDSDQRPVKCGEYQVFAKIICHKVDACELLIGESKQSKLEVILASGGHNLSYFSGQHITMKMKLTKLKGGFKGEALETPTRQFGAIKKGGIELIKVESCK